MGVSEARKLTEAKQGLLTLHDALHPSDRSDIKSVPGADKRRDQLCLAVRQAVEAETEARELLDAKRELLAQQEVLLKESDRLRLEQVSNFVERAEKKVIERDTLNTTGAV